VRMRAANSNFRIRACAETSSHAQKLVRMRESVRTRAKASAHAQNQIQIFECAHAQKRARIFKFEFEFKFISKYNGLNRLKSLKIAAGNANGLLQHTNKLKIFIFNNN